MMDFFRGVFGTRPAQKRRFEEQEQEVSILQSCWLFQLLQSCSSQHLKICPLSISYELGADGREGIFGDAPRQKGGGVIQLYLPTV